MMAELNAELLAQQAFWAQQSPQGPEMGKASPLGLLVILLLLVGVFFLIRSMNNRLKGLPQAFDAEHPEPDQAFDEGTDSVAFDEGTDPVVTKSAE